MKRAAIYVRKSRITEKGNSIQSQIKMCEEKLLKLGIKNYTIYTDEGFSGKNSDRPDFSRMLQDAKTRKFDALICYKFDRVSRNVSDFSSLIETLNSLSVSFISVVEQFDTSTPIGKAMMNICGVFSELERDTISLRVADNMYALAERGYWLGGECPTGYKSKRVSYIDSDGKKRTYSILEPIQKEIKLVQLIFEKYIEFKSLSKLEKYTLSNNIKTKNGKDFAKTSLSSILKNPSYVKTTQETVEYIKNSGVNVFGIPNNLNGMLIYKHRKGKYGEVRKASEWIYAISSHAGVIDSLMWVEVQRNLERNKNKAPRLGCSHNALLAGLVRCYKCGHPMRVAYGSFNLATNKRRYYYMCTLKHNSGKTRCDGRNANGIDLDSIVMEKLKSLVINKELLLRELKKLKKKSNRNFFDNSRKDIKRMIKKNEDTINNIVDKIALTSDDAIAKALLNKASEINKKNTTLKKELLSINTKINGLNSYANSYINLLEGVFDVSSFINTCNVKEKKQLLSSIIDKVYINSETGAVKINFKNVRSNI